MKNVFVLFVLILVGFVACQEAPTSSTAATGAVAPVVVATPVKQDTAHATVFACSMHPEITGKEGDKCSKCGMALTAKK